jgi:hypothetical protein
MIDPMVGSRQPQTRWLLTCYFLVIVIASHSAAAGEKHHGLSPNEYPRQHFLSALYGIAVAHGEINLNATLEQLGIDHNEPSLTPCQS